MSTIFSDFCKVQQQQQLLLLLLLLQQHYYSSNKSNSFSNNNKNNWYTNTCSPEIVSCFLNGLLRQKLNVNWNGKTPIPQVVHFPISNFLYVRRPRPPQKKIWVPSKLAIDKSAAVTGCFNECYNYYQLLLRSINTVQLIKRIELKVEQRFNVLSGLPPFDHSEIQNLNAFK